MTIRDQPIRQGGSQKASATCYQKSHNFLFCLPVRKPWAIIASLNGLGLWRIKEKQEIVSADLRGFGNLEGLPQNVVVLIKEW